MSRKSFLNLTQEEKKKLRSKKISQKALEECSIKEISEILNVSIERARVIALGDSGLKLPIFTNSAFYEAQRKMDLAVNPLRGLSSVIANLNQELLPKNAAGMEKLMTSITQKATIHGTTSKYFQQSVLLFNQYERLRINDWATKVGIAGLTNPNLGKAIAQANSINTITQKALSSFAWNNLGKELGFNQIAIKSSQRSFFDFSTGFQAVLKSLAEQPTKYERFPLLAKLPAVEYQSHSAILEIITTPKSEPVVIHDLVADTNNSIQEKLPLLHSGFMKMWLGAKASLKSDNPDRIRHFHTSVRELLTHIMHILAPDDEVRKWSTSEKDFYNDKPTRKSRLNYICRDLDSGSFGSFLSKDLNAMVGLFEIFQVGTHGIEPDFTEAQLSVIELRVENYLRFLLEIEFKVNRQKS